MNFIKKHLSFPMLLLALVVIFGFGGIISSLASIISPMYGMLSKVSGLVNALGPVALLVILWLNRAGKLQDSKIIVGVIALVMGVVGCYGVYRVGFSFFQNPSYMDDIYQLMVQSPLYSLVCSIFSTILLLNIGIQFLRGKDTASGFTTMFALGVIALFFVGILSSFRNPGKMMDVCLDIIYLVALWYIPKSFAKPETAEISGGRVKLLMVLLAAMVVIYFVAGGAGVSSGGGSGSTNTCGSCGRSFSAGDAGGNYMNIARTGMCNNCENNYHSLEWVLD